jgi:MarR family transcriptional regulator, organic hydroperoxide resistance regulator
MNRASKQRIEQGIGYKVRLLSQLLSRRVQADLVPYGLTPFHYFVLRCLWEEDGLPVSSIGSRMQELGGTMTGVIDRMEERGLLNRKRDRADRRIWRVYLTEKGRQLEDEIPPIVVKVRKLLAKGVDKNDYEIFEGVLDELLINAAKMVADSQS